MPSPAFLRIEAAGRSFQASRPPEQDNSELLSLKAQVIALGKRLAEEKLRAEVLEEIDRKHAEERVRLRAYIKALKQSLQNRTDRIRVRREANADLCIDIAARICAKRQVRLYTVLDPGRTIAEVVGVRQEVFYTCAAELRDMSLKSIGDALGFDHTSVAYGIKLHQESGAPDIGRSAIDLEKKRARARRRYEARRRA